jgi:hypothetical protein
LRDGEQVGDADEREEEIAREAGDDGFGRHTGEQCADEKGSDKREHAPC